MIEWLGQQGWLQAVVLLAQDKGPAKNPEPAIPFYVPLIGIAILFYFMLIRPERRKRAEQEKLLENLAQNDQVITIGGIMGRIVSLDKESVVIRLEENAKIRVLRSAISRVVSEERTVEQK